jgi:anti-anti-sigma factor
MHDGQLRVTTEVRPDAYVLYVSGEIDIASAPELRAHLHVALSARPQRLIVDLSQVSYLDSSGIAELTRAGKALQRDGGSLFLQPGKSKVKKILDVLGLTRVYAPPETEAGG